MNAYNGQRIGAATVALGLAEGAYDLALAYAQEREQFGRPICEFQGVQWMLADMATQIAGASIQSRFSSRRRLSGRDRSGPGQDLYLGDGH